jgi:hypothetical protein
MTTYRGLDGFLSLGGVVTGTPTLQISAATGASEVMIYNVGSTLTGIIAVGDKFTISDGVEHTVAGTYYAAVGNSFGTVPIATTVATVAATGATVAFTANTVGECKLHSLTAELELLDSTVMGDEWRTFHATATLAASWSGSGECYLDYDDVPQKAMIDDIAASSPTGSTRATVFAVGADKLFYGSILMSGFTITHDNGALVTVQFNFTGAGSVRPEWN